jgi:hypothetical protein
VALWQFCGGHRGTVAVLWWTSWQCGSFVVDIVALWQFCGGHRGTVAVLVDIVALWQFCGGHSGTVTVLWWTSWHCGSFVVDIVAL